MALTVTRAGNATDDLATMAETAVLGCLTIPGHPRQVREARTFVARLLGEPDTLTDTAVLLTSELVTNAIRHTASGGPGGTVEVVILGAADAVQVEVTDNGSDLSSPVVKGEVFAPDGHGLYLVETLAQRWGYLHEAAGTTVWFRLGVGRPGLCG